MTISSFLCAGFGKKVFLVCAIPHCASAHIGESRNLGTTFCHAQGLLGPTLMPGPVYIPSCRKTPSTNGRIQISHFSHHEELTDWFASGQRVTRGQWPYRPTSKERAMINRPMILHNFNFPSIDLKEGKKSCLEPGLNPGPLAPHSNTLTTMPRSLKKYWT